MIQLSIIIPTLNEADNIDRLFEGIASAMAQESLCHLGHEVIVVDDQSRDQTVMKARAWSDRLPIKVIERQGPADLSGAVLDGVTAATSQWVVVMDADGSHPPSALPALIAPLIAKTADVVVGSRHIPGASTINWPWQRHLTSRLATLLAWPFTEVKDPMAGFFATERERLLAMPKGVAGYKILLELLVQGGDEIAVKEIPIRFEDRQAGQSKLSQTQQLTYLRRLMNLGGGRVSGASAGKFFGVGLVGMVIDLSLFALLVGLSSGLALAHMLSFAVATMSNFTLNYRWSFKGKAQTGDGPFKRYLRFLIVAILAMLIRGGVLVALTNTFDLSPMLAIVPAIIATAGINYLGSAFYVFATTESGVITRVRWHLAALGLFAYVFALRWLYLGQLELIPDEMYYWVYGQHLAWAYLDHPPLTAWLIWLSTTLFGDNILGVRAMLVPLVLIGAFYFYRYGETMGGRTVGLLSMLALVALPFFFLSGLVMTPDAPMIVAWAAALYYLKRLLIDDQSNALWGLGLAMGIGLLAKYSIALIGLAGLVFMLIDAQARRYFFRPELYGAMAITFVLFAPVIVWNAEHSWASFGFQFTRRLAENPDFSTHLLFVYAFALLSPIFAAAAFYLFGPARKLVSHDTRKRRFMLIMTLVPLAVFAIYGLFSVTKFHWTPPAWIALIPMVMWFLMGNHLPGGQLLGRFHRILMKSWAPSLLLLIIAYGGLLHYLTLGLPGLPKTDLGAGYLGWSSVTQVVEEIASDIEEETGQYPIVAATDKWGMAAAMSFHGSEQLRQKITAQNLIGMSGSMWGYWFDETQSPAQPVLLVHHKHSLIDEPWIEEALIGVGPLQSRPVYSNQLQVQTLYYRLADGFRPEQLRTATQMPPSASPNSSHP